MAPQRRRHAGLSPLQILRVSGLILVSFTAGALLMLGTGQLWPMVPTLGGIAADHPTPYMAVSPGGGASPVVVVPALRRSDPVCPHGDTAFEGECISAAERGTVFRDPCEPWGSRVKRTGFQDFRNRTLAQSPGRGMLERMRAVCDMVSPLINALAADIAAATVPYNATDPAVVYKTMRTVRPLRTLAFGPLLEQGTCAMVADAVAAHGVVGDYVLSEYHPGLVASLGAVKVDATRIAFPDNFFHFIAFSHVIEHVSSMDAALSELARVLRPEGVIILNGPVMWSMETTKEDPACAADEACRISEYKQSDHVRLPGRDIVNKYKAYFEQVVVYNYHDWYREHKPMALELFRNSEYHPDFTQEKMILGMQPIKNGGD